MCLFFSQSLLLFNKFPLFCDIIGDDKIIILSISIERKYLNDIIIVDVITVYSTT